MTISREELRDTLTEFFDERARVDAVTHGQHHEWIAAKIESERERTEMYQSIAKAVISWSIPALLGGLWYFFRNGTWPGSL